MNDYALLTWSDGTFLIRSEHSTKESGIIAYDELHAALINDNVAECSIRLVDKEFNIVDNKYFDVIRHTQPTQSKKKIIKVDKAKRAEDLTREQLTAFRGSL